MNNYINPYLLIKELYSEAETISEKFLAVLFGMWIAALGSLVIIGATYVLY